MKKISKVLEIFIEFIQIYIFFVFGFLFLWYIKYEKFIPIDSESFLLLSIPPIFYILIKRIREIVELISSR
ncbi:hypothetical protein CRG49_005245 [Neisseria sp. N95_16]|nr:hypothetical protein CRG49_005245 [Neisseria sp. N95_16]PJO79043.1 hypothetical protein CWC45_01835 [Neisseria sp. N177_16]